jgi:hypothetical protein
MIEAVYGQGEGLVSGEITPDRFVMNKYSTDLVYQQLTKQTHKFVKAASLDGVEKVEISEPSDAPVLNSRELRVRKQPFVLGYWYRAMTGPSLLALISLAVSDANAAGSLGGRLLQPPAGH